MAVAPRVRFIQRAEKRKQEQGKRTNRSQPDSTKASGISSSVNQSRMNESEEEEDDDDEMNERRLSARGGRQGWRPVFIRRGVWW